MSRHPLEMFHLQERHLMCLLVMVVTSHQDLSFTSANIWVKCVHSKTPILSDKNKGLTDNCFGPSAKRMEKVQEQLCMKHVDLHSNQK